MNGDAAIDLERKQVVAGPSGDDLNGETESRRDPRARDRVCFSPPPSTGWYVSAIRRMRGSVVTSDVGLEDVDRLALALVVRAHQQLAP